MAIKKNILILLIVIIVIVFLWLLSNKPTSAKTLVYEFDDSYRNKINNIDLLLTNGSDKEIKNIKFKSHLSSINNKNGVFQDFLHQHKIEFDSIVFKNNNLIITSKSPELVMINYCQFVDLKCLKSINHLTTLDDSKLKVLKKIHDSNDDFFYLFLKKIQILSKPTRSYIRSAIEP